MSRSFTSLNKLDPAYITYLNLCTTKPSGVCAYALNNLFTDLRKYNLLGSFDKFWIFAQDNQTNAKLSLINSLTGGQQATEISSPTWTALQGYTGNGTSSYIQTNFNPLVNGINYTQNSACFGVYFRSNVAELNTNVVQTGVFTATTSTALALNFTTFGKLFCANSLAQENFSDTSQQGLFAVQRSSSTIEALYKNGVSISSQTQNSTALVNLNWPVLAWNINGTVGRFSNNQAAAFFVGAGNISQANVYTCIQNYMTILRTQV